MQLGPDGSALGSSLESQPVEMARGALTCTSALARITLTLGEFTVLFVLNGPILQPYLVLHNFPFFPPQALQVKYLNNKTLKLGVRGSSEVLVCRSPSQHPGGLCPCLGESSCTGLGAVMLPHAWGKLQGQEGSLSQKTC